MGPLRMEQIIQAMLKEYDDTVGWKEWSKNVSGTEYKSIDSIRLKTEWQKQKIWEAAVYPVNVLNPYDSATGKLEKTADTVSIHWYAASWMNKTQKLRGKITRPIHRIWGVDVFKRFRI